MKSIVKQTVVKMSARYSNNERGYTLLEYCAGAAIIAGIVWAGLGELGDSLFAYLDSLGNWVEGLAGGFGGNGGAGN